jgi:tRNA threonylcarbamoyladenosine biosynthesis protein TsaE
MCYDSSMIIEVTSAEAMQALGAQIGDRIMGGEVIVLIGDIGAGKTTFTKGLARAMGISEDVQSPTFTVSRVYETARGITLAHYDFYRLNDPGIMRAELMEAVHDPATATIIEWSEIVSDVLPADALRITITATSEETRTVELAAGGELSRALIEEMA